MRLLTYNLRFGGASKLHWTKVLAECSPDVFFVQETFEPMLHLSPAEHGELHRNAHWQAVTNLNWGTAIWSRDTRARPLTLPDFQGHLVGLELNDPPFAFGSARPLRVFSVHAPNRGGYHGAVHGMLDTIAKCYDNGDVIVGGDFNLTVGERHAAETLTTSSADRAILTRLRDEFGLASA